MSDTLTVTAASAGMSGDQFRVVVSNPTGTSISVAVALTLTGATLLQFPAGIALDGSGNLYVADSAANTIRQITPAGVVSTLAGLAGAAGSADGRGATARFNQPAALAVDRLGNVDVADTGNALIRRITPDGTVTTVAGSAAARGNLDGAGGSATFNAPGGIAVDADGTLFVADTFNATIRKITPAGVVSTLAGAAGVRGDGDGSGGAARFNQPAAIALDAAGNLYVADNASNTIRRIAPDGAVTTLAGLVGVSGAADGSGVHAFFNQPGGVAVDSAGSGYVADTGNSTVRKITAAGAVSTPAGLWGVAGLGDGAGDAAFFNQPRGVAVDGLGNVFVADTGNAAIRKLTPGGLVTTLILSEVTAPATGGSTTPAPGGSTTPVGTSTDAGGGGGALGAWLSGALAVLGLARWMTKQRAASSRVQSGH